MDPLQQNSGPFSKVDESKLKIVIRYLDRGKKTLELRASLAEEEAKLRRMEKDHPFLGNLKGSILRSKKSKDKEGGATTETPPESKGSKETPTPAKGETGKPTPSGSKRKAGDPSRKAGDAEGKGKKLITPPRKKAVPAPKEKTAEELLVGKSRDELLAILGDPSEILKLRATGFRGTTRQLTVASTSAEFSRTTEEESREASPETL